MCEKKKNVDNKKKKAECNNSIWMHSVAIMTYLIKNMQS